MSLEAMVWALTAPDVPAPLVAVLFGLANHADPFGHGAYPSIARLQVYARKGERQIQMDLRQLEERGIIRKGNQAWTQHLPPDRRPTVYDLALERRPEPRGPGGNLLHPGPSGVQSSAERGAVGCAGGVQSTAPEPSLEPSLNQRASARSCSWNVDNPAGTWEAWIDHRERCLFRDCFDPETPS